MCLSASDLAEVSFREPTRQAGSREVAPTTHHGRRVLVTLVVSLLSLLGPVAAATAAPVATAAPTALVTPAGTTDWVVYEHAFKSYATCEARAAVVRQVYGGTHHGAVAVTKCKSIYLASCHGMGIALLVRYVSGEGGGGGGTWAVQPNASRPAAAAA